MKPGEVFHPNSNNDSTETEPVEQADVSPQKPPEAVQAQSVSDDRPTAPEVQPQSPVTPQQTQENQNNHPSTSDTIEQEGVNSTDPSQLSWEASDSISYQKGAGWTIVFILVATAVVAGVYWMFRDIISVVVTALAAGALLAHAFRRPSTTSYSFDNSGIRIGTKEYGYDEFKSFSVIRNGGLYSISLEPTQRFMIHVNIYFPPEYGDEIVDHLSEYLPHKEKKLDIAEQLLRRLKL